MVEYKIENVRGKHKNDTVKAAEEKMNEMAKDGWRVVGTTEFMAVEFGYSFLITFEKS